MPIVLATITELPPKYKIVKHGNLLNEVIDFIVQYGEEDENMIKELAKKFDFSIDYARLVADAVIEGNFL